MFRRIFLIMVLAHVLVGPTLPALRALDFSWTAGSDVLTPLLNSQDADAGVVQDGPVLSIQTALEHNWSRYSGSTLDNLVKLPDAARDASFTSPNGDDIYWTNGIWQDTTGKRYAIIHIEYNYNPKPKVNFLWKRRIGLATSTDKGANWHYEGDILTTNPSRPRNNLPVADFQDFGCGDTYLLVDRRNNFFYLYYMTAWVLVGDGWRTGQEISVARCPISQKMAPGSWTKFNGGTWTQPGLGGFEAAVFSGTDATVVHFNTYLNAFVAIGHDSDTSSWISSATSLVSQNWQPKDFTFPQRLYWYNWPINPVTNDRHEIGQTFRLYSAQANVGGVGTKYFNVTLSKNGNAAPTANMIQPEEGSQKYAPGPITLIGTAADADGSVAKMEFFANQVKVGELTSAPYVFLWKNVTTGSYRITVRATDNTGAATESAGVNISVTALTFTQWKTNKGLSASAPATLIGASGRPLLVDYALNLDYENPPTAVMTAGQLSLTYCKARTDVSYLVERSDNLLTWTSNSVTQGTPTPFLVTASTPASGDRTFLHVKLSYP